MTETRFMAMAISLGYSVLTVYAVSTGLPGSSDLVTAIALLFLVIGTALWVLPDEAIYDYANTTGRGYEVWLVGNLIAQLLFMAWAGWWLTLGMRIVSYGNELIRETVAFERLQVKERNELIAWLNKRPWRKD